MLLTKYSLDVHMQGHEDTMQGKRFQCALCKKTFTKATNLQIHKRTHKNEPPEREMHYRFMADHFDMSCDQCDATFTTFHDARQHYKDKHNEVNGYIKCCAEKLRTFPAVRDHINAHLIPEMFKYEQFQNAALFFSYM